MGRSELSVCRFCGKEIGIITYGIYRKTLVDIDSVLVVPDENGEIFVRIDGTKVKGREVPYESAENAEPAYRPHAKRCTGRK